MATPLSMIPEHAFIKVKNQGKFAPKLDFGGRCAILALVKSGVDRRIVAAAMDIDRRTVTHVVSENGAHYRDVRKEYKELGHAEFVGRYLTEQMAIKVVEAANAANRAVAFDVANPDVPKPRANGKAGIQVVKPPQCKFSHRLEIKFFELRGDQIEREAGWHYRDLDSATPDVWLHNGELSLLTSQNCLKMAEENLIDD